MTDNHEHEHEHEHDIVPEPLYCNGVDLSEPGAQQYWCKELGCKPAVLGAALRMAGSRSVEAVSAAINFIESQKQRHESDGCSPG